MTKTCIIAQSGDAISVPCGYSDESLWFRVNVKRYTYKTKGTKYKAEIEVERIDNLNQNIENLTIYRSNEESINCIDKTYKLLESLLEAINNKVPVWDIRDPAHNSEL